MQLSWTHAQIPWLYILNIRCGYFSCNIAILPQIPRGMYRKSYISRDIDTPLPACNSVWPMCIKINMTSQVMCFLWKWTKPFPRGGCTWSRHHIKNASMRVRQRSTSFCCLVFCLAIPLIPASYHSGAQAVFWITNIRKIACTPESP